MKELYSLAKGLDIEGGWPAQDLNNGKWINLVIVLDRPLIDHDLFDDIFANNKYPLLENAIEQLDESRMLVAYLTIIGYYIYNGRNMVGISTSDTLRITVHIHQDVTCQPLIDLLRSYVDDLFSMESVTIDYCCDQKWYKRRTYQTDILISLSQCAGLSELEPGTLLVPDTFIPYDIKNRAVHITRQYFVNNDLIGKIKDILNSKYHELSMKYIQQHYISANKKKQHKARLLIEEDFHQTAMLQVAELWNPKNPEEEIHII